MSVSSGGDRRETEMDGRGLLIRFWRQGVGLRSGRILGSSHLVWLWIRYLRRRIGFQIVRQRKHYFSRTLLVLNVLTKVLIYFPNEVLEARC